MSTSDLYELVFSSGVEQALLQTGRLPEPWTQEYLAEIQDARSTFDGALAWPKQVFQAFHYSSMHLPLRYDVWASSANTSNSDTEHLIAIIRFETEAYLWSSLPDGDPRTSTTAFTNEVACGLSATRLVELCFGNMSPIGGGDRSTSFRSWKELYEESVRTIEPKWKTMMCWPKWLCMAIHFASFYIDLFQKQNVDLAQVAVDVEDIALRKRIDGIIHTLKEKIENEAALDLIRLWLSSCSKKRDSSGLPKIREQRPRTGQFISVRTISEAFLLEA